jgi:helix-turn-helix resolvase-like protein
MTLEEYRRRYLSPERLVEFFARHSRGAAFISVPPGFGKTHLIISALMQLKELFSVINYAASQHRIVNEVYNKTAHLNPVVLVQQDRKLCGPRRYDEWQRLHGLSLSYIGRPMICRRCPNMDHCPWYHRNDAKSFLYLQSQDYLFQNLPAPKDGLVILDEDKFLELPLQRRADRRDLEKFAATLRGYPALRPLSVKMDALLSQTEVDRAVLAAALNQADELGTHELKKQYFRLHLRLARQELPNFLQVIEDPGRFDLYHRDNAIYYTNRPLIDGALLALGYGLDQRLLEHYFGRPFTDLNPTESYMDPGTRFYQLASSSTSYGQFSRSSRSRAGIYRMTAEKIMQNRVQGKRTLLIAKKKMIPRILKELPGFFPRGSRPEFLPFKEENHGQYDGTALIPILHYGVEGINSFEHYDTVICLTAYNIKAETIQDQLRKLGAGLNIEVEIQTRADGSGREVFTDPATPLAEAVFDRTERQRIMQVVSRARPFTTPTEVIFAGFQKFDGAVVFRDVRSLMSALRLGGRSDKIQRCSQLRSQGMTIKQIAKKLGVGMRTVSRYLIQKEGGYEKRDL